MLVGVWAALTPILVWAAPGRSEFTIPDLVVAGSAKAAAEVLSHWSPNDRTAFAFMLGFDFLYDLVHNNAVALVAAWAVADRSFVWVRVGSILAWLLWFATAANILEAVAFFQILQSEPVAPWPQIGLATTLYRNAALLSGILLALVAGPGCWVVERIRTRAA